MNILGRKKRIQKKIGARIDGVFGKETITLLEKALDINVEKIPQIIKGSNWETLYKNSPNWRGVNSCEGVLLHHSSGSFMGSVNWCLNPESGVSYHCIIHPDGYRVQLCEDNQKAWHAGKSSFKGRKFCNSYMLGLAFSGDTNKRDLTESEISSAADWIRIKMRLYGFGKEMVTDHRTVSPGRKYDLNPSQFKRVLESI